MKNEPLVIERTLQAPIDRVWKAITNKDEMKQWYFDLAEFRPEVGFEFQHEAGKEGRLYLHLFKVTEVVPGRRLQYSWQYKGYEGLSYVTFELFAEGDKTRLRLTHEGLETFPAQVADLKRENFFKGWTTIIGEHLPEYLSRSAA
jgi:uncharacterized protein YndB with AHSA1/START domain